MQHRGGRVVGGASMIALVVMAASLVYAGADVEGWLLAARYTARWSFMVFLAAYLGPVLVRGLGEADMRAVILAFGAVHGIHLAALVTYRMVVGEAPGLDALAVGGLAYGLIAVLVTAEWLQKSGRVLRAVALHYAWFVFVLTYATRLGTADLHWVGMTGVAVGLVAFVIRLGLVVRGRVMRGT